MPKTKRPHVLFAVLNWGLGHASRSVPLIDYFLKRNCVITIASDGNAGKLLRAEFPDLQYFELPSYRISYSSKSPLAVFIRLSPHITKAIILERKSTARLNRRFEFDLIISDGRLGCRIPGVRSVFIAHQINIVFPVPAIQFVLNLINRIFLKRFDQCWIPDYSGNESISGNLSACHPRFNCQYLGPISRLNYLKLPINRDVLVLLSGPEPQRTKLENILVEEAKQIDKKFLFVRGLPPESEVSRIADNIEMVSFLPGNRLERVIANSRMCIARAGYSTIMDFLHTKSRALLIPTPGQPEQEHLVAHLNGKGRFLFTAQDKISLKALLPLVERLEIQNWNGNQISFTNRLDELSEKLSLF